jgi:hypothetical protein
MLAYLARIQDLTAERNSRNLCLPMDRRRRLGIRIPRSGIAGYIADGRPRSICLTLVGFE